MLRFGVFGLVAGGWVGALIDEDSLFGRHVRVGRDLDCKLLVDEGLGAFLVVFLLFCPFSPLQALYCLLGS